VRCEEAALLIGADPGATTAALEEHLRGCAGCTRFREEMRGLDADIRRALEHAPDLAPSRRLHAPPAWRQWALAASVALGAFLVLGVWLLRPSDTLAREVVAHVQHEPESWLATRHVTRADIDRALRGAGVALDITSDRITYAQSCWMRGHYVPHFVVQTTRGQATLLILRHEHVSAPRYFSEAGMTGVIVPAQQGSIAVLARGPGGIDEITRAMQRELRWLPQSN
jgi:hypothetical protein